MTNRVPVFRGATRLPTFAGVPRTVILFTAIYCGVLFMFIHLYALFVFAILFAVEWTITKHDDKMFNILFLAAQTTFPSKLTPYWKLWNGSSASPAVYEKPIAKMRHFERMTVTESVKKAKEATTIISEVT